MHTELDAGQHMVVTQLELSATDPNKSTPVHRRFVGAESSRGAADAIQAYLKGNRWKVIAIVVVAIVLSFLLDHR